MKSDFLPRELKGAERQKRIEAETRLPEKTLMAIETALRTGLWKKHGDDVRFCEHVSQNIGRPATMMSVRDHPETLPQFRRVTCIQECLGKE